MSSAGGNGKTNGNVTNGGAANGNAKTAAAGEHRLELTQRTDAFAEWQCPRCGRQVRLEFAARRFRIVVGGDQSVNHGSATLSEHMEMSSAVQPPSDAGIIH